MTTHSKPYRRLTSLVDTFADWLKHWRELDEIRQLDRVEFDRIARDLEISSGDLDELVRHGSHAADELPVLLKASGIDRARLASSQPMVLRDMERVCTLCIRKAECDRHLAAGSAAEHHRSYCPQRDHDRAARRERGRCS